MEANKNIHLLPTDKPSRLRHNLSNVLVLTKEPYRDYSKQVNQNIYITNDEEIKEGGYVFWEGKIYKYRDFMKMRTPVYTDYFSIILTTDQDLIKDGVQAIDDEFLEWFVKNPSCEFVNIRPFKKFKGENEVEPIYKIIIPKESKQETLEEAAERYTEEHKWEEQDPWFDFMEGAKWQQERSYSEEDMIDFAMFYYTHQGKATKYWGKDLFKEWFEQFKK